MNESANIALLECRTVVRVSGADRFAFLQNLISRDLAPAQTGETVFTGLLNPQGKYLFGLFIRAEGDSFLVDVEASRANEFIQLLNRYRLRADVAVSPAPEFLVYEAWEDAFKHPDAVPDPRLAALGQRLITSGKIEATASEAAYREHRYKHGVGEGSHEIAVGQATLAEANFDALNGISFEKGCYLGQELTARIHYRGLVKRRYLPFHFEGIPPKKFAHILHNGFEIAEVKAVGEEYGLGLFHLEAAQPFLKGEMLVHDGTTYEIFVPEFLKKIIPH